MKLEWPVRVFESLDDDFFNHGPGAIFFHNPSNQIYVIIPFLDGRNYPVVLCGKKWGWDTKTLSLIPGSEGKSHSIGAEKNHAHFIIENGVLKKK